MPKAFTTAAGAGCSVSCPTVPAAGAFPGNSAANRARVRSLVYQNRTANCMAISVSMRTIRTNSASRMAPPCTGSAASISTLTIPFTRLPNTPASPNACPNPNTSPWFTPICRISPPWGSTAWSSSCASCPSTMTCRAWTSIFSPAPTRSCSGAWSWASTSSSTFSIPGANASRALTSPSAIPRPRTCSSSRTMRPRLSRRPAFSSVTPSRATPPIPTCSGSSGTRPSAWAPPPRPLPLFTPPISKSMIPTVFPSAPRRSTPPPIRCRSPLFMQDSNAHLQSGTGPIPAPMIPRSIKNG
ncbi:MAG: hypothetical protein BWY77_00261 [bacterium ADurb.Bin431]|nr:MAG: hypothetical protein BWY77_00261 [bacterium ADurb.Bin431]